MSQLTTVPVRLDLHAWLSFCLGNEEIDRLLALEEIRFQGLEADFCQVLRRLAASDPSAACKDLAEALLRTADAHQATPPKSGIDLTPERARNLLETDEDTFRAILRKSLRKAPPDTVLDLWRAHVLTETDMRVVDAGLTLLGKFGNQEDAALARPFSFSESQAVVLAAIDLLHNHDLPAFRESVVNFLTDDRLDVRLHAIRRLRSIDAREARNYLQSLLGAKDPLVRQKALRELMLFPFKGVESLYLSYIGAEPRPLLLVLAGIAITMNPLADMPLQVYDVALQSHGIRETILQQVVQQLLVVIQASGVLAVAPADYLVELKTRLQQRKAWIACQLALPDLDQPDPETRLAAVQRLRLGRRFPKVRQALEKCFAQEQNVEVKDLLAEVLEKTAETVSLETFLQKIETGDFFALQSGQQRLFLGTISNTDDFRAFRPSLHRVLSAELPRSTQLKAIETIEAHGHSGDVGDLLPLLKSPEPAVIAASLRVIGLFDIDRIVHELTGFLQHEDIRVRTSALELYLHTDKQSALQYIRGMLRTPSQNARRNGLALLAMVDYPSAEPLLFWFIQREKNPALQMQAGFILAGNPTAEGLDLLHDISHNAKGEPLADFAEVWEAAQQAAVPALAATTEELLSLLGPGKITADSGAETSGTETATAANDQKPEYAFAKVSAAHARKNLFAESDVNHEGIDISLPTADLPGMLARVRELLSGSRNAALTAGGGIILAILFFWGILYQEKVPDFAESLANLRASPAKTVSGMALEDGNRDAPALVAGHRTPRGGFLSGRNYGDIMQAAEKERDSIREQFRLENERAFRAMLEDMRRDPDHAMYADLYLNDNCKNGIVALECGDLIGARDYFLAGIRDSSVAKETKLLVCQALMGVGWETNDQATIFEALKTLMQNVPPDCIPPGYEPEALNQVFLNMEKAKQVDVSKMESLLRDMATQSGQFTPQMQTMILDGFKKFKERFP